MPATFITPVALPDSSTTIFTSKIEYPNPYPWDSGYYPESRVRRSYGQVVLDNGVYAVSATDYNVAYYAINNSSWFRFTSQVTAPSAGMSIFNPVYNTQTGKILCGFYSLSGNNITARIFESQNVYTFDGTTNNEIAMTQIFDGVFDPTYYGEDSLQPGTIALGVFPSGGVLTWGITVAVSARAPRVSPAYWAYGVVYNPVDISKYIFYSTYDYNLVIDQTAIPPLSAGSASYYAGGIYYFFSSVGIGNPQYFAIEPGANPLTQPGVQAGLSLPGGVLVDLSASGVYRDTRGNWICPVDNRYMLIFAQDFSQYLKVNYIPGDGIAKQFLATGPSTSDPIGGFSFSDNALLMTNSPRADMVVFTNTPLRLGDWAGPGPIIPVIKLSCQNYCLPMFKRKNFYV